MRTAGGDVQEDIFFIIYFWLHWVFVAEAFPWVRLA